MRPLVLSLCFLGFFSHAEDTSAGPSWREQRAFKRKNASLLKARTLAAEVFGKEVLDLHDDPSVLSRARRNLYEGSDLSEDFPEGWSKNDSGVKLEARQIETLFEDVAGDPHMQRVKRYALKTPIFLVLDSRLGPVAGTAITHNFRSLIELSTYPVMGLGFLLRTEGSRALYRAVLVHEIFHARVGRFRDRWLKRHGLPPEFSIFLRLPTEEYLAHLQTELALGRRVTWGFKFLSWMGVAITERGFPSRRRLVDQWPDRLMKWRSKLEKSGVRMETLLRPKSK